MSEVAYNDELKWISFFIRLLKRVTDVWMSA
jgi:hypothetical protein